MNLKNILFCFYVFILAACGGGGGGGGSSYSITLDKSQVSFTKDADLTSETVTVRATFKGDGVVVGYPPNVQQPGWLSVLPVSSTSTSATFNLSVNGNIAGNYSTTVRFITGKSDGSKVKYVDLPVTLLVKEGFSALANTSQFDFDSLGRSTSAVTPMSYQINITGADSNWNISANNWITLSKTTGKGAATVTVGINPALAVYGSNTDVITVTDSVSNKTFNFNVNYQLSHADVIVDTESHHFRVGENSSGTDLVSAFSIADELNGASSEDIYTWELVSASADWLSLSKASGTTVQGAAGPEIVINKNELLNNPKGERYEATLVVKTQSYFAEAQEYTIDVSAFIEAAPTQVSNSTPDQLDYNADRAAFATTTEQLLISDTAGKRLYIVDANSGETTHYYEFNEMPESLSVSPNGHYLFVALLIQEHNYYQNNPGGKVAVIDLNTGLMINKFDIDIDPWDIEGADNGNVFVSAASGQWTYLKRYKGLTGEFDVQGDSRHQITIALHPDQETLFTLTTDLSPGYMTKYFQQTFQGTEFLNHIDASSPGDNPMGWKLWTEPSGDKVFTTFGNLFKSDDLTFVKKVLADNTTAEELAFDEQNNRVFVLEHGTDKSITTYDLPDYDNYHVLEANASDVKFIFNFGGNVLLIEQAGSAYQLRRVSYF